MVLTMEFDYFEAQPHWQLVHSVSVFDSFVCVGSKRSYYDLFEGYPSNIEQETPSCLLQLHRVTMPLPDSSSELPTLVSAPNFNKALFEGPKRSYYNLFEVYPSIIEREQLSCLLRLHRVTMPPPDSSSELPTLVSAPNFDKALFEGPTRSNNNLFEVYPSIIERERLSCSPVCLFHRKHTRWRWDHNLLLSFVAPLFGPVRTGLGQAGPK